MLARTFWTAFARGRSAAGTESGLCQLLHFERSRSGVDEACTASMRRGTVSAANMSPVPEKNSGSCGVSMRKRRGLWSEVAVLPIIVRFEISEGSTGGGERVEGCELEAGGVHDWGWDFAGSRDGDGDLEAVREGVREGTVWLSFVRRREVMMTWGTW